jgi:hypothetical protein
MKILCYGICIPLLLLLPGAAKLRSHSERTVKEFPFRSASPANLVRVENISGSVQVEAYEGEKVIVEAHRLIESGTDEGLNKALRELALEFEVKGDSILCFLKTPFARSDRNGGTIHTGTDPGYRFTCDFTIRVPQHTNLSLSTVNGGEVTVAGLTARSIRASHVNGSVTLRGISAVVHASTVNGDIRVSYAKNPEGKSLLETVNGEVEVLYPGKLSALLSVNTFHGDFYTDLRDLQPIPSPLQKVATQGKPAIRYRRGESSSFKAGDGKAHLDLKTLNGTITVKADE